MVDFFSWVWSIGIAFWEGVFAAFRFVLWAVLHPIEYCTWMLELANQIHQWVLDLVAGPVMSAFDAGVALLGTEPVPSLLAVGYWLVDQIAVADVVLGILTTMVLAWPVFVGIRLALVIKAWIWAS